MANVESGAVQASKEQIAKMAEQLQTDSGHTQMNPNIDILETTNPENQAAVLEALTQPPKIEGSEEELVVEAEEVSPDKEKVRPQRKEIAEIKQLREDRRALREDLKTKDTEYRQFQQYMMDQLLQVQRGQQPAPEQARAKEPNYDQFFDPNSMTNEDGQIDPQKFASVVQGFNKQFASDTIEALEARLGPLEQSLKASNARGAMQQFGQEVGFKPGTARKELADVIFAAVNANPNFPEHMVGKANDLIKDKIMAALDEEFKDRMSKAAEAGKQRKQTKQTSPSLSGGGLMGQLTKDVKAPPTVDEGGRDLKALLKKGRAAGLNFER